MPTPPDLQGRAEAYEHPTLVLAASTAEALLEEALAEIAELEEIGGLRPIVDGLVAFDEEVKSAESGDGDVVEIRGAPVQTDAVIDLFLHCPGWPDGESVMNAVQLTVVVEKSELIPVAWGTIRDCRFEASTSGATWRTQLSGEVEAYLPTILSDDPAERIVFVAYNVAALEVNGQAREPRSSDLRLVGQEVEVRVALGQEGYAVVGANRSERAIRVRAKNGEWVCHIDERRCDSVDSSSDSFSY